MNTRRKKIEAIAILVFAGILLATAMISPAAAQPPPYYNVSVADAAPTEGTPGEKYLAYNVTYEDNDPNNADPGPSLLLWFNVTALNQSVADIGAVDDIINITVTNATTPSTVLGYATTIPATIDISSAGATADNSTYVLSVWITLNDTGLIDGKNIAINATLRSNVSAADLPVNDTEAETIEVLNATAGTSDTTAGEGDTNVLCANVTITPGNTTATQYLKKITFNNTATEPTDPAYIVSFGLWNDSTADGTFNPTLDYLINSTVPTTGSSNVTFDLTGLSPDNRIILAGGGTFFLTMNITSVAHTVHYQAYIFAQNITINQTAGEGNTGNYTATTGFTLLTISPSAAVPLLQPPAIIALAGILGILAVTVMVSNKKKE